MQVIYFCHLPKNFQHILDGNDHSKYYHFLLIFDKVCLDGSTCCEDIHVPFSMVIDGRHGILIFYCLLFVLFDFFFKITESWWKRKTWWFPQKHLNSKSWLKPVWIKSFTMVFFSRFVHKLSKFEFRFGRRECLKLIQMQYS